MLLRTDRASFQARPASLEHFLTERYCLYTVTRKRLYRGRHSSPSVELQIAEVDVRKNTMAQTAGLELGSGPDLAYFARELKVLFWAPERLL